MENRLEKKRFIDSKITESYDIDIDQFIKELKRLKKAGATHISITNEELSASFYDKETDQEAIRREQKELVELARLKTKYEPQA